MPSIFSGLDRAATAIDNSSCTNYVLRNKKKQNWTTKIQADFSIIPVLKIISSFVKCFFYTLLVADGANTENEWSHLYLNFVSGMLSSNSHAGMQSTWTMNAFQMRHCHLGSFLVEIFGWKLKRDMMIYRMHTYTQIETIKTCPIRNLVTLTNDERTYSLRDIFFSHYSIVQGRINR